MKRLIAFAVATVAAVSLATAEIAVGARGIFGIGLGTTVEPSGTDFDFGNSLDFGGTLFAKIPVWESLVVQPEVGFTHNMIGRKMDTPVGEFKTKISYNAIDIPVLVGWDLEVIDGLTVTPLVGPKVSIPVGKAGISSDGEDDLDVKIDSAVQFSVVVGAGVAYKLGPGALVGDLRYNIGITELKLKDDFVGLKATPRALQLSVGYQMAF